MDRHLIVGLDGVLRDAGRWERRISDVTAVTLDVLFRIVNIEKPFGFLPRNFADESKLTFQVLLWAMGCGN